MARKPLPLRLLLAAAAASAVSAIPASRLAARADTCAANGLQACPKGLPDHFCCPQNSLCTALAGATTVMCCPNDRSCSKILPITCNIREQDPAKNPKAPIQTTVFDVALPKCGDDLCCPFGYSCTDGGRGCIMNEDQSKAPRDERPSPSPTIATSTRIESATSAASTAPSQDGSGSGSDSGPERTSIIGGAVGGCLVLVLVITVVVLCIRRRRRAATSEKASYARSNNTNGSAPYGNVISAPVLQPGSYRSDFLRGSPPARRSFDPDPQSPPPRPPPPPPSRPPRISIPNPFDSPTLSGYSPPASGASITSHDERTARTGHVVGARLAPIRAMKASEIRHSRRPSTQYAHPEASSESINVFADPSTVHGGKGDNRTTTLSDMMEQAGLGDMRRGRPYVPGTTPRI